MPSARLEAARHAAARAVPAGVEDLTDWLRIPSVSGTPRHRADVGRAAEWLADRLRRITPAVEVRSTGPGPLVVARVAARGSAPPAPAIVVYGHLDVRPAGPGWTSPPFEPVRRGARLVARGASDDKGQLMAHLVALEAWAAVGGPPVDVVVLGDGAEEVGSPGLERVLAAGRRTDLWRGEVGAVVVSDTRQAEPGRPSLTVSQRGTVALRVSVDTGGVPVHAGRYGGAVVDPNLVLAAGLARAEQALSRLRPACRSDAAPVPDALVAAQLGGRALAGPGLDRRATRRAAVTVSGWRSRAAAGSIPTRAQASLDVRVPAGADPEHAARLVATALRSDPSGFGGTVVEVRSSARGGCLHLGPAQLAAVRRSCLAGYGRAPRRVASGGSLPVVRPLESTFGAPVVLLGFGPVDDHAHGPDEYLDLRDFRCAVDTAVNLLAHLGAVPDRRPHDLEPTPRQAVASQARGLAAGERAARTFSPDLSRPGPIQGALHRD